MTNVDVQPVLDYLDKIAAKLGTTVEQIWPWMIKQQYVEAIYPGILLILFGVPSFFLFKYMFKHWYPKNDSVYNIYRKDHEKFWIAATIIIGIFLLILLSVFLVQFGDIFNAEYWAFNALLSHVSGDRGWLPSHVFPVIK